MLSTADSKELQRAVRTYFRAQLIRQRLINLMVLCGRFKVRFFVEILPRADYDRALEEIFKVERDAERIMYRLAFS